MTEAAREITPQEYTKCILHIADSDGLEIANTVNHMALESKQIPLRCFQAAAAQLAKQTVRKWRNKPNGKRNDSHSPEGL